MENLGDSREKIARRPEVDKVKGLMGVDFFKNSATEKETKAKNVIRSFNMQGIETIDDLFNRTEAPNYNQNQAKEKVNILATAIYETMQESGDKEVIEAAISGSFSIAKQLPPAFIGEDRSDLENGSRSTALVFQNFVDKFATETDKAIVYNAMENFDYIKNNPEIGIETGEAAKEALEQIKTVSISGKDSIESRARLVAYLSKMSGKNKSETEKSETINGNEILKKIADDIEKTAKASEISAKQAAARYELEHDMKTVSLGEQVDAYLYVRAPRERAPQQWEYDVPPEFKNIGFDLSNPKWRGLSEAQKKQRWNELSEEERNKVDQESWRQLLNFMDRWLGAIYNKRANSDYNNSLEKMSQSILNMQSLPESELKKWYDNETLNLSVVMRVITNELMVPEVFRANTVYFDTHGNQREGMVERKRYVFKTVSERDPVTGEIKNVYSSDRVKDYIKNEDIYKQDLVERLVENKVVQNKLCGALSVAIAMNVMEMGGVLSAADTLRKLSWESDAVRLAQRPETKFRAKVDKRLGELFAGPWSELSSLLAPHRRMTPMQIIDEWGVIPIQLAGSFLDKKQNSADSETIMDTIYRGGKVNFKNTDADMFFGWRKDHIMPAARLWMYTSNKQSLEFSKNRESDAVISQWRTDLFNDLRTLRSNEDSVVDTPALIGAIGGSVGLWPFEGPYLRIGDADTAMKYSSEGLEIIRILGLNSAESTRIINFFGIDRGSFRDFNMKYVNYIMYRNKTIGESARNRSLGVMMQRRR